MPVTVVPVKDVKLPVVDVTVTAVIVVPVTVVPVKDVKTPVANLAVVPVTVVPLRVPVTLTPAAKVAAPLTPSVPVTVKFPLMFCVVALTT